MTQGGWSSLDTITRRYRANVPRGQVKAFQATMGHPTDDADDPELPGYG